MLMSFSTCYTCILHIVVVVPDTGGTRCMVECPVECPQCLGLQLFCVICCHPDPLLHPPDTTTPLLAKYLLIKIWLPGNRLQMYMYMLQVPKSSMLQYDSFIHKISDLNWLPVHPTLVTKVKGQVPILIKKMLCNS